MKANVNVKIQGIKGGNPSYSENKGYVSTHIDNIGYITVDAFNGQGDLYKRRNNSLITINIDGIEWSGTINELKELINR